MAFPKAGGADDWRNRMGASAFPIASDMGRIRGAAARNFRRGYFLGGFEGNFLLPFARARFVIPVESDHVPQQRAVSDVRWKRVHHARRGAHRLPDLFPAYPTVRALRCRGGAPSRPRLSHLAAGAIDCAHDGAGRCSGPAGARLFQVASRRVEVRRLLLALGPAQCLPLPRARQLSREGSSSGSLNCTMCCSPSASMMSRAVHSLSAPSK